MKEINDNDTHEAFQFPNEPRVIDLGGDKVYALFQNDYIDIMFDLSGNILTREEKSGVVKKYLEKRGKKFTVSLSSIEG